METQTRLSRHNKFISPENIIAILSVSSDDSLQCFSLAADSLLCGEREAYILHGTVSDSGFHALSSRRADWRFKKKKKQKQNKTKTINIVCSKSWGGACAPKFVCVYVRIYIRIRAYIYTYVCVYTGMHLYIYTQISACRSLGRAETMEESARREEWLRERNGVLQSEFLFLSNFMVAKDLF